MNRRGVLQSLGLGALAAPMAAQSIGETISRGPPPLGMNAVTQGMISGSSLPSLPPWQRAAVAFLNPAIKEAVRAALFEQCRDVTYLDPDLANKRSFSLAAKITFQRERNVERELTRMESESGWSGGAWSIIDKLARSA